MDIFSVVCCLLTRASNIGFRDDVVADEIAAEGSADLSEKSTNPFAAVVVAVVIVVRCLCFHQLGKMLECCAEPVWSGC